MLLSIDISITSTGYCIFSKGNLLKFGVIKTSSKLSLYDRLAYIEQELLEVLTNNNITHIVVEAPSYGSRGAMSYQLFGVHFSVVRLLSTKFKVSLLNISKIKKFATGNGRAKKPEMVEALPNKVKVEFEKSGVKKSTGLYDLTDSYFIGKLWLHENKEIV